MSSFSAPSNPGPGQPVYIAVQPKPSLLARLVGLITWLGIALFVLAVIFALTSPDSFSQDPDNKLEERYHSLAKDGVNKVAVIEIDGVIEDGEAVKKQVDKVLADPKVKAVVLRVDSPGGTVTGSDFMYHHLRKLSIDRNMPFVVSMGGLAASGGYYVSMACGTKENVIFAEPTTWTGSIGVLIPHYNIAGLMEKWEVEDDTIKSAPLKGIGSITRKMTPEEKAVFEELVKESFDRFKGIVKSGRPKLTDDQLKKATTGQVFTTKQALELGLVDKQGFVEDAIARAMELASLDAATTKAVKYHRPKSLADTLVGASAAAQKSEVQALLDLATPKAYYLFSWPNSGK
ncbi:MAG: signal peptide peptidase SppA [Planctomycetia bacterium]|nr:signal peptide peptidase SppA [Planctomycetia bacterium]